jgi:hypothetical protein
MCACYTHTLEQARLVMNDNEFPRFLKIQRVIDQKADIR